MLHNTSTLIGCSITASDGTIGTVTDLLFDDATWTIRWLVIDAGSWLVGRNVLLPPSVLGHADTLTRIFNVRLTKAQVAASPEADTHLPVSRQHESDLYDYYRWSPYWGTGYMMAGYGGMGAPMMIARPEKERRSSEREGLPQATPEPHLRSAAEVTGYHIHANDGEIGHLSDILVEEEDWTLRYLVVNTSNWWMGKKVLISPRVAKDIMWTERMIYVGVDREMVKTSPLYDPNRRIDRAFEDEMAAHYAHSKVAALT